MQEGDGSISHQPSEIIHPTCREAVFIKNRYEAGTH